jgi:hypothetical protein
MRIAAIFAGILLLVIWGLSTIPAFNVNYWLLNFDIPNPINMIANISLVTFFGFSLTIGIVILAFAVLLLVMGVLPSH